MSNYRIAESLDVLRRECDARAPGRNKASDGWIGDAAHAATASDHNPNPEGVVCALDVTNDPGAGADVGAWADFWRQHPHPDVKYCIWNRQLWSAYEAHGVPPFTWRPYSGSDPHTSHVHVSVGVGPDGHSTPPYDDQDSWFDLNRGGNAPAPSTAPGIAAATAPPFLWDEHGTPMPHGSDVQWAQHVLRDYCEQYLGPKGIDGWYGRFTADGIEHVQRFFGIRVDRIVGPQTWGVLHLTAATHGGS